MQRTKVKGQGHRGHDPIYEMMHKAWCCLEEVPYCFSRSFVKFEGHMAKKV